MNARFYHGIPGDHDPFGLFVFACHSACIFHQLAGNLLVTQCMQTSRQARQFCAVGGRPFVGSRFTPDSGDMLELSSIQNAHAYRGPQRPAVEQYAMNFHILQTSPTASRRSGLQAFNVCGNTAPFTTPTHTQTKLSNTLSG